MVHNALGYGSAAVAYRQTLAAAQGPALPLEADALAWLRADISGPASRPAVGQRGQVIIVHLRGRGPRLGLNRSELDLASSGTAIQVRVDDRTQPLHTLVDINALAARRDVLRRSLTNWRASMRDQLGAGNIGQECRSWRTLPARIDVGRIWLPVGPATIDLLTADEQILRTARVQIKQGVPVLIIVQHF